MKVNRKEFKRKHKVKFVIKVYTSVKNIIHSKIRYIKKVDNIPGIDFDLRVCYYHSNTQGGCDVQPVGAAG